MRVLKYQYNEKVLEELCFIIDKIEFDEPTCIETDGKYYRKAFGKVYYAAHLGSIILTLSFPFEAINLHPESFKDSFSYYINIADSCTYEANFMLADDDGTVEKFYIEDIESHAKYFEDFREAAKQILPKAPSHSALTNEFAHRGYQTYIVNSDNTEDLKFNGKLIGYCSSYEVSDKVSWKEMTIFKTVGNKYICDNQKVLKEKRQYSDVKVCDTLEEVKNFFGFCATAKKLYEDAGISYIEFVE